MACLLLQGRCSTTSARPAAFQHPSVLVCTMGPPMLRGPATPQTVQTGRTPDPPAYNPGHGLGRLRGRGPRAGCPLFLRTPGVPRALHADTARRRSRRGCRWAWAGPVSSGQCTGWGWMPPGAAHAWSLPSTAPAPEASGVAGSCRAQAPARCWGAPTSPRSTRGSTRCTGTAVTCWPRWDLGLAPTRAALGHSRAAGPPLPGLLGLLHLRPSSRRHPTGCPGVRGGRGRAPLGRV